MVGTSIDNLRNLQDYGSSQAMQFEQGHNAQHQSHQAQQVPYYDMPNNEGYPKFNKPEPSYPQLSPQQMQQMLKSQQMQQYAKKSSQEIDIEELTKDINNNILEDTFFSLGEGSDEDKKQKSTKGSDGGFLFFVPREWREPLLLLLVYLLLSQKIVTQTLGNYISQLNPTVDGTVGFAGLLIYGVLLVAVYFLAKKYLL